MSEKIRPGGRLSDGQSLLVVCAWCGAIMREGAPPVSHGICPACTDVHMPGGPLAQLTPAELDRLPFGLIRLSGDGTILSYNKAESDNSGRPAESVVGQNFLHAGRAVHRRPGIPWPAGPDARQRRARP